MQRHSNVEEVVMNPINGPDIRYEDFERVDGATTLLFVRRSVLVKLSQLPGFVHALKGLFVRVRLAGQETAYLLCRVVDVELGQVYALQKGLCTDYYLVVQSAMQRRTFPIVSCSGSHPLPHEFDTYESRLLRAGGVLTGRSELN